MADIFWHNLKIEEIEKILRADIAKGLSSKEVHLREKEFGKNKIAEEKPLPRLKVFFEQFKSPLIYILIIAGIITFILGEFTDSAVIFGAVFINTIVGYFQENKALTALRKLKKIVQHYTEVKRQGSHKIIKAEEIVPGDIIILKAGDRVPADARLIKANDLKINEMVLTGEWLTASKKTSVLTKETPLADRDNMVYMGTIVEGGQGQAIIVSSGTGTEIGKISEMLEETEEEKTPYQKKIAHFSRILLAVIVIVCSGIFIEGIVLGKEIIEMFTTSIAIVVAALPESLPIVITVILALGAQKILKKKGLIRRLSSAETLGSTSIICTDKTGTLTKGKMEVAMDEMPSKMALKIAGLCSEAFIENPDEQQDKWIFRGRPTDKALLKEAVLSGIDGKKEYQKKKLAEFPFNSINKFSAGLYQLNKKQNIFYICGAPEKIMAFSQLSQAKQKKLKLELDKQTKKGLRVVATGYRKIKKQKQEIAIKELCQKIIFTGFITLKDPIRKDVKSAISLCRQAGIKPIIVTGDHKFTAKAVAQELGFKVAKENILEGAELDEMTDIQFQKKIKDILIYARVEPKHKLRIISAWQERGEVVAMTGDGVNDAPALKKADIGLSLGSGTEVAKGASDLILLNNSFSVIVAAVEQGRTILDNIRKVMAYLLTDNFTEVILIGVSIAFHLPLPITAAQILWINFIVDEMPAIALGFEPTEKDVMKQKAINRKTPLLTKEMKVIIFGVSIITDLLLLGLAFWLWTGWHNVLYLQTMIFAALAIDSILYVFSFKSFRKNIWQMNLFSNKLLCFSWIGGFAALFAAIYIPALNTLLGTIPLKGADWLILGILGLANIVLIEAVKWYFIRKKKFR